MTEWSKSTVENCLERVSLSAFPRTLARDYKKSGKYPIVDQGQSLIAGWTDDAKGLISTILPVVVFGDHTCAFKYVDFPFVRGADGTQILKPTKAGIEPLFFYYACKAIDLQRRGYNRHFKALKEKEIPIPPLDEQHFISFALRQIDDALSLQDEQIRVITDAKRATMRKLFTRGLRGETPKETEIGPVSKSWQVEPLGNHFEIVQGLSLKGNLATDGSGVPFLRTSNVYWGRIDLSRVSRMNVKKAAFRDLRFGDLLVCEGGEIGRAAVWSNELPNCTYQNHVYRLRPSVVNKADPKFVMSWLEEGFCHRQVYEGVGNKTTIPNLSRSRLSELKIPIATLDEQREIVTILDAIDRKIYIHRRKQTVLDDLFKALLHKLMTGEIRVADLDLSVLIGTISDSSFVT